MEKLAILGEKGGGGKSTAALGLAVAFALAGKEVAVIDLDPQATAAKWSDRRGKDFPAVVSCQVSRLDKVLEAAASQGAQLAVIDTPGSTPPLASLIVPVRLALDCATAEDGSRDNTRILRVPRYFGMTTSESRWATARMRARVDNRIDRGCQSAVEVDCAMVL